jgi:hypothetical protein
MGNPDVVPARSERAAFAETSRQLDGVLATITRLVGRDEAPEKIRDPGTPSIIPSGAVTTAGQLERFTDGAIATVASSASSLRSTGSFLERHPRFVDVARETPARSNPTTSLAESIPHALGQSFFR